MKFTIFHADGSFRQTIDLVGEEDPESAVMLYLQDGESFIEGEFVPNALSIEQTEDVLALDRMKALLTVRAERKRRLFESDWTQIPDAPLSAEQRAAWQTYRQALRDLPETTENPADVDWPVPPSE